ncbi:MAG: helix-turn-helix transcriptional regulator [bacterium]
MTAARNVAANVRRLAAQHGLPIAHVADFAGLGRNTLFRLLSDEPTDPRLSTVDALAAVFSVPAADLLRSPDAPFAALPLAPLARYRKDEPVTPDHALAELRARLDHARATDADAISIPLDLADAVTRCAGARAADLLAVLGALDLADCSPRMILRRAALIGGCDRRQRRRGASAGSRSV